MKLRSNVLWVAGVVAMGLLAGASAAQEPEVIVEGNNATGIRNLTVGSDLYDVIFVLAPGSDVYPGDPPDLDFSTESSARQARDAVVDALNTEPEVSGAGPESPFEENFAVGYKITGKETISPKITAEFSGWGPIDGWSKVQSGVIYPFSQTEVFAKFEPPGTLSPEPTPEPTPEPPPPDNAVQVGAQTCQYMNINQAKFLEYRSEGVLNTNTVEQWIVCPVGAEVGTDTVNSRVRILNNSNVTAETQCLWKLTNQSGNTVSSKSLKQSIPPGESYYLFASNLNYEPGVTLTISCKLPPQFLAVSLTLEY